MSTLINDNDDDYEKKHTMIFNTKKSMNIADKYASGYHIWNLIMFISCEYAFMHNSLTSQLCFAINITKLVSNS